jgi:hypothetical protein
MNSSISWQKIVFIYFPMIEPLGASSTQWTMASQIPETKATNMRHARGSVPFTNQTEADSVEEVVSVFNATFAKPSKVHATRNVDGAGSPR